MDKCYVVFYRQWSDVLDHDLWQPDSWYESELDAMIRMKEMVVGEFDTCKIDVVYYPEGKAPNI